MLWHEATRPQFASCLLSWVQYWLLGLCFLLMPDGTGLSPAALLSAPDPGELGFGFVHAGLSVACRNGFLPLVPSPQPLLPADRWSDNGLAACLTTSPSVACC